MLGAIARAAADGGRFVVLALYLLFLALAFVGMGRIMVTMAQGPRPDRLAALVEPRLAVLPAAGLAAASLLLGVVPPAGLLAFIREASHMLGVG